MDFTYIIKKNDIKKYLKNKHRKINIVCILFFVLIFILINYTVFMNNKFLMSIFLTLSLLVVCTLIFIVNKLFIYFMIKYLENEGRTFGRHHIILDEKHIEDTVCKNTLFYLWKDIYDVKYKEDSIILRPKDSRYSLVFQKSILTEEKFKQLEEGIKKYYKK